MYMKRKAYIAPKADLFTIPDAQHLLVTFSMSGTVEDYEGAEEEDF